MRKSILVLLSLASLTVQAQFCGIGISTPSAKLHIKGSGVDSTSYSFKIADSNNVELFFIRNDKRAGLNVKNPLTTFQINSNQTGGINLKNSSGSPRVSFFSDTISSGTSKFTLGVDVADSNKFKIGTRSITTNTRLAIDTSGKIGMGTSTPSQILHISKTQNAVTRILVQNTSSGTSAFSDLKFDNGTSQVYFGTMGSNTTSSGMLQANSGYIQSTGANGLNIQAFSGTIRLAAASSTPQVVIDGGNLNVSTSQNGGTKFLVENTSTGTSSYTNHMFKNATYTSFIGFTGTGFTPSGYNLANQGYIDFQGPNGLVIGATHSTGLLQFLTGGSTESMRIGANGKVGINTTSPAKKLEVLDNAAAQLRLAYTAGSVYTDMQTNSSGNFDITPSGTEVSIIGNLNFNNGSVARYIKGVGGHSIRIPGTGGHSHWAFLNIGVEGSINTGISISNSKILYYNDYGIYSFGPSGNNIPFITGLHGTSNNRYITIGGGSLAYGAERGFDIKIMAGTGGNASPYYAGGNIIIDAGALGGGSVANGAILLASTVLSNVGIGTTSPTSLLHTVATGAKTASYTGHYFSNTATSSTASINKYGADIQSTGTWNGTSAINVGLNVNATGGTTNYAALFSGGNIGVGTSTPNASALVDVTSTTQGFLPPRMTATQASAITAVDGLMLYVTSTNGTFTAIGFWGYENGVWIKL